MSRQKKALQSMADTHRAQDHLPTGPIWPGGLSKQGPHRVGAFATCPQLEAFAHELHLRPAVEKLAPAVGNLVHVGLAYRYGMMLRERPPWLVYASGRDALWICGYNNTEAREEALRIFDAYEVFYQQNTYQPLLVEHQFEVSIEGEPYTARTDLLAMENGEVVLIDHKCLPADSIVQTLTGPRSVGELRLVESWSACARKGLDRLQWAIAMKPEPAGLQDVYQLKTKGGVVGRYGWRHPVLTRTGFVAAKDLKKGDEVAVAARLPTLPEAPLADALIALAGMLIGDGGFLSGRTATYTKTFKPFRDYFKANLHELGMKRKAGGGVDGYIQRFPKIKAPYISFSYKARPLQMLDALGFQKVGSAEKRIPQPLLSLSQRQAGILVGAFWSSDGAMYVVKERRKNQTDFKKLRIVYASRSYGLCCDVRHLLNQLGLLCTVTSSSVLYKGKRRGYHFTTVVGRASKRRFLEMICSGAIRRPAGAKLAKSLLPLIPDEGVAGKNPVFEGDFYWDRVESVLFAGKELTYHIEVPGNETFVADGLVTHNTTRKITSNIGRSYRADRQMMTGLALARSAGWDVKRVVINALSKEQPTPRFARFDVPISPTAYGRLGMDTAYVLRQMKATRAAYPDPTNRPRNWDSCVRKYGVCDFYGPCTEGNEQLIEYVRRT